MVHLDAANRRASDRFRLHAPYTRRCHAAPARLRGDGRTASGAGIRRTRLQPLDDRAALRAGRADRAGDHGRGPPLPARESCPIRACGQVVRIFDADDDPGPRRMAVHFETFASDAARNHLARLIEERRFGRPE